LLISLLLDFRHYKGKLYTNKHADRRTDMSLEKKHTTENI